MKTAEEWFSEFLGDCDSDTMAIDIVRRIQADAHLAGELAGMTEAAEICERHEHNQANQTVKTFASAVAAEQSRQDKTAILTARDAKALAAKEGK